MNIGMVHQFKKNRNLWLKNKKMKCQKQMAGETMGITRENDCKHIIVGTDVSRNLTNVIRASNSSVISVCRASADHALMSLVRGCARALSTKDINDPFVALNWIYVFVSGVFVCKGGLFSER